MNRIIGHIDLDYFFAQVEEVENPVIKERPVLVCVFSGRTEDSGVVSTANYRARELGVRSGMPIVLAKKKLEGKEPVLIPLERGKYDAMSERVMQIVADEVDVLQQTGIDEAFFDITKKTNGDFAISRSFADRIKKSILESEHLTCSIGLGRSKAVAKLASDSSKPAGLLVIEPESTESFLNPLPVTKLYGVGPKAAQALEELKIRTVGELKASQFQDLEKKLGRSLAIYLQSAASGTDDEAVLPTREMPSQLSRIITLKRNTRDPVDALAQLGNAVSDLEERLTKQNVTYRTISAIAILTDLSTRTKSKTFETPMRTVSGAESSLLALFEELGSSVEKEFRRVGVRVSDLESNENQSSLSEFLTPA